uniref:Uncharacterized protein n=1 Tax=Streptomyces sp. F12 TaxID=1436084 RepID=V9Z8P2_9ACTN|nr:hypothetical protein pFRL6_406c [Streptomyces sp. F12]
MLLGGGRRGHGHGAPRTGEPDTAGGGTTTVTTPPRLPGPVRNTSPACVEPAAQPPARPPPASTLRAHPARRPAGHPRLRQYRRSRRTPGRPAPGRRTGQRRGPVACSRTRRGSVSPGAQLRGVQDLRPLRKLRRRAEGGVEQERVPDRDTHRAKRHLVPARDDVPPPTRADPIQ